MTRIPATALAPEERPTDPQRFYEVGATAAFASAADQRFSYSLYIPRASEVRRTEVAVLVHDTMRAVESYRAAFAEWSERTGVALLLPLFPAGIGAPFDLHGYKYLDAHGVRYDSVLLAMLDEASAHFHLDVDRVLLFGFSGGGQFVHRFALLHPERVRAVSVGAPGGVTLPGDHRGWWVGTADTADRFGRAVEPSALRGLRVQALVGEADLDTWEVSDPRLRASPYWMPGADDAGRDRVARMASLADALERVGAVVTRTTVPGAAHDPSAMFGPAMTYFDGILAEDAGERA
ncbi:PHB depolymerase family esterase [Agromyces silvae]|uniref:PHB depolymerase family esterase n=1 Tax=Agromyces silvae TaxID=3388266 RepID=UPI00280BD63B|nr:PHB depolymerase family esterase [Agromyces protaetiae]